MSRYTEDVMNLDTLSHPEMLIFWDGGSSVFCIGAAQGIHSVGNKAVLRGLRGGLKSQSQ